VFSKPVYMKSNDSVTYFHTYQLEGFPENQRFNLKWRNSQTAEFKEGDFVEFQYLRKIWNDRVFYDIIDGTMRSDTPPASKTQGNHYQQPQPQQQQTQRLHSPSHITTERPSTQESHDVAEAHTPTATTTTTEAETEAEATPSPTPATPYEIRIKALQVMRDILVMRQQWASSTTKSSAPSLEDFVKELLAGAKSIERYLTEEEGHVVGESCEGRVEPAVEGKSPLLLRRLEMPGENLDSVISGENGEVPSPPPSTAATPTLLQTTDSNPSEAATVSRL